MNEESPDFNEVESRECQKGRIWLIGGTSESAEIALAIAAFQLPCTITVTTTKAIALYPKSSESLRFWVGRLNLFQMQKFCDREQIVAIIDASHPFAIEVSESAIATAKERQIPLLRYERPEVNPSYPVIHLDSFNTLLEGNYLEGERVLLTVGCKILPLFKPWQNRSTLFARLLPTVESTQVATAAGFTPEQIIALRPPISAELEKALWRQWQISLVVTKASGKAGGEDVKISVAAELGIPIIIIERPKVAYPQQTSNLEEVITFCRQYL